MRRHEPDRFQHVGRIIPEPGRPPPGQTATLQAVLDFGPAARQVVARLNDAATSYVVQVFTPSGQLLASLSGTRTPGSGPVTVTIPDLPAGTQLVARVVVSDASGNPLGFEDLAVTLSTGSSATTLTFDNLTPGAPPPAGASASPSPSPGAASPSPSPAATPTPAPSPSPATSPSPAASPGGSSPVSLAIQPQSPTGPLVLQVGTSQTLQVLGTFADGP